MIATFDLHDRAYEVWRDAGASGEVLVHIDAHHDAARDPAWTAIDIGNYVRAAIRDGMVADARWIVPDPMWRETATRRILLRELRTIGDRRVRDDQGGPLRTASRGARTRVEGIEMWLGPLAAMPPLDVARARPLGAVLGRPPRPVLLNVDVDYLLTARYEKHRTAEPLAQPWCWPDELVPRLRASGIEARITTVATSVTGGFTPLRWAHLAREIAVRLGGETSSPMLDCFAALRDAARLRKARKAARALAACRDAASLCPDEAAAHFHLAEILQAIGNLDEARGAYRRACALDPSYAHPFRTRGPYLYRRGRVREAEAAWREGLALDPDDSHAHLGLAMIAIGRNRPADARRLAEHSLVRRPDAVDAWRALGQARAALGEPRAAVEAYERAMALSLRGAVPLGGPWSSNRERRLVDPGHWTDHAAAGDLRARLGDLDAAIAHYTIAAAGSPGDRRTRARLARLKARRRIGRPSDGVLPS